MRQRVTEEQIRLAKSVDLISYMKQYEPQELIRTGPHDYKTTTHSSLCISDNGLWHWFSHGVGGRGALNYLIQVKGMDFVSAVRHLCELEHLTPVPFQQSQSGPPPQHERRPFTLPVPDKNAETALQYLKRRGIDSKILKYCIDQGILYDPATKIQPHTAKAEFVLSLCEQIMGRENIQAGDKSLIDRSLKHIYKPLIKSGYKDACPTLTDLYNDLKEQPHERAHEIALALELFATGSMNMFAHPTNVDMSNRLICFNIQSLGDQLKPVAMLSMLEYINTCVMSNERNDPKAATWVYFDEIYLLLRDKLSSQFLYTSWKRFRKYNAYATGITQNVQDCLSNDTAYAMLANSEFVCMLRQTKDIDSVVELYGLSDPQKNYLKLAKPGQGILKMGNNLIPFVNDHPTNTKTYRLLTTKPGEMEN